MVVLNGMEWKGDGNSMTKVLFFIFISKPQRYHTGSGGGGGGAWFEGRRGEGSGGKKCF